MKLVLKKAKRLWINQQQVKHFLKIVKKLLRSIAEKSNGNLSRYNVF